MLWFLCTALSVIVRHCLPNLESFESLVTKLHSRQEMLYKNISKGNNYKENKFDLKGMSSICSNRKKNEKKKLSVNTGLILFSELIHYY